MTTIRLHTQPTALGAKPLILFCHDCARPTAHELEQPGRARCLYCDACQVACAGAGQGCGAWVKFEGVGLVHLCEACEEAVRR